MKQPVYPIWHTLDLYTPLLTQGRIEGRDRKTFCNIKEEKLCLCNPEDENIRINRLNFRNQLHCS